MTTEQSEGGKYTPKLTRPLVILRLRCWIFLQVTRNPASPAHARLELEESCAFFPISLVKTEKEHGKNPSFKSFLQHAEKSKLENTNNFTNSSLHIRNASNWSFNFPLFFVN